MITHALVVDSFDKGVKVFENVLNDVAVDEIVEFFVKFEMVSIMGFSANTA